MKWLLAIVLLLAFTVPTYVAFTITPIGEGPDELDHIDYTFFRFTHPDKEIDVQRGLLAPGYGPIGQGHQAPLSYWFGAKFLRLWLSPAEVGSFFDYQAGLVYSSASLGAGGSDLCMVREDPTRADDPHVKKFRFAIKALRSLNAFYLAVSVLCTFLLGRVCFPDRPRIALLAAMLHASLPTAIWRSTYVSNDNAVAIFCSLTLLLSAIYLLRRSARDWLMLLLMSVAAVLTFLAKYNGIVALGIVLLAILLRSGDTALRKIARGGCVVGLFVLGVSYDLWTNYRVDGDIFSEQAIIRTVPFLYHPVPFFKLLFDQYFVPLLLERQWLEFQNVGYFDARFSIHSLFYGWHIFLILVALGLIVSLGSYRRLSRENLQAVLFCFGSFVAMIVVMVYAGTKFPMPAGRYIHPVVGAFSLFAVFSLLSLFSLFAKKYLAVAEKSLLVVFGFNLVAAHMFTAAYFYDSFAQCRTETPLGMIAGADFAAGDLDGDGKDELFLYHRCRTRVFVAKEIDGKFQIVPEWTRQVGLSDQFFVADMNGDKHADVILYRPSTGNWFFVSGNWFLKHHKKVSPYSEHALRIRTAKNFVVAGGTGSVFDVDGDGQKDLVVYDSPQAFAVVRYNKDTVKSYAEDDRTIPSTLLSHRLDPQTTKYSETNGELVVTLSDGRIASLSQSTGLVTVRSDTSQIFDPGWYSADVGSVGDPGRGS